MSDSPVNQFRLLVHMPDGAQSEIPVADTELRLGRQPGSDLILAHASVSRAHALMRFQTDGVFIEDLGSSNGTSVDGEALVPHQPRLVQPGMTMRLGQVELRLLAQVPPDPAFSPTVMLPTVDAAGTPQAPSPKKEHVTDQHDQARAAPPPQVLSGSATGPAPVAPAASMDPAAVKIPVAGNLPGAVIHLSPAQAARSGGQTAEGTNVASTAKGGNDGKRAWWPLACGALLLLCCIATVLFLLLGGRTILQGLTNRQKQTSLGCEQPVMPIVAWGGKIYNATRPLSLQPTSTVGSTVGPSEVTGESVLLSDTGFLEMPFPINGTNDGFGASDEQFRVASQRNTGKSGGRINSFFDHYYPLYPASKDPGVPGGSEPAEKPIGENILLYDGSLSPYFAYSGHPAYDFSTFEPHKATTPVYAAADGLISDVGEHKSGALVVRITHQVAGVGTFQTSYWHLEPDSFYEATRLRKGTTIKAGERIGTMGNTGYSTGHHLHFEVRFDANGDGVFSGQEVVDPYGWTPSAEYPDDPWQKRSSVPSSYLWAHPLGVVAAVTSDGGGALVQDPGRGGAGPDEAAVSSQACIRPGSLPPGGKVYWTWSPDPPPGKDDAGVGHGCTLSVQDAAGVQVREFSQPVKIEIPYTTADLSNVKPDSLAIYWRTVGGDTWEKLETTLFPKQGVAVAFTSTPGTCSLRGKPLRDLVAPVTEIHLIGEQAADGAYFDKVQVKLEPRDDDGVAFTEYSLDGGSSWQEYSEPFTVMPGQEIPKAVVMDEEFFAGTPGTHLVLAVTVDQAGNREDPPAYLAFSIDISKNPKQPVIPSPAPSATSAPTLTPEPTTPPDPQAFCDHPFMPLRLGAHWDYQILAWDITAASDGTALALTTALSPVLNATHQWVCTAEGLNRNWYKLNYITGSSATFSVIEQNGVSLPPAEVLLPGYSWSNHTVYLSTSSNGGTDQFTVDETFVVTGNAPVTFNGQTYDGIQISYTQTISGETATSVQVLARGVGYVGYADLKLASFSLP